MTEYIPLSLLASQLLLVALFVPRDRVRRLFPTALAVGMGSEILAVLLFTKLIRLFVYANLGIYGFRDFPIFIIFGWIFFILLYLHFLPQEPSLAALLIYTAFFALSAFGLHEIVDNAHLMTHPFKYFDWVSPFGNSVRFLIAYWVERSGFFHR